MNNISDLQIGWIAGILEGEGCFGWWKAGDSWIARVYVNSNDEDVIERLLKITGIGKVYGPRKRKRGNDYYSWVVSKNNDVIDLLCLVQPLMLSRRREKANYVLDQLLPNYSS